MYLTLDLIFLWTKANLDIVFFIYGLAFVGMGIAIWAQPRKESRFKLAHILWLLAGFGFIHGTNEFLDMWAIVKGTNPAFDKIRTLILVVSFIFLFGFGRRLLRICSRGYLKKFTKLLAWPITLLVVLTVFIFALISSDFWKTGSIFARYFLGFPGALLTAFGFILYFKSEEKELGPLKVRKYFLLGSAFFIIYGVLGGLIVPKAGFFPASFVNTDSFFSLAHIPVQALRAICAIIITLALCGMLRIFIWESTDRLKREINERTLAQEELKEAFIKLKEAQDYLIQVEKLNAVGQLASGVAHEVRNPLAIILQSANFLEKKVPAGDSDTLEVLNLLKDNIKRADGIINALLDFSRATKLSPQPEDINSILESSIALARARLQFEKIEVVLEAKKDLPRVLADKNKLEQVFINILLNAAQAMPEGGRITIRSYAKRLEEIKKGIGKRNEDSFQLGEDAVIVEAEDTGVGISEENLKKIFVPFFTTKGPKGGTGLGLSVSRNILQMHKGLIFIESEVGKGTKITVVLKIAGGIK